MANDQKLSLKRKRGEGGKVDTRTRVLGKLHHELHEIRHACKKARTFETQKLVKKLKQLRDKDDDKATIQDHEAQLNFIKTIDHNKLAHTVLKTKCHKDKTLRDIEPVQAALKPDIGASVLETPSPGTPGAKVQSRLLSNKIIASQVASSIASIKAVVNPELAQPLAKNARPESPEPSPKSKEDPKVEANSANVVRADSSSTDGEDDKGEAESEDLGWESGTVDGDDADIRDSDAGEEADDGWESGSVHGSDPEPEESDDEEPNSDSEDEDDLQVKAPPSKKPKATAAPSSSKSRGESTFLPSLAMGYMSGSDASDIDESTGTEPRKNRRGQRARRAIWEKKFGRNANHKKKEAEALKEKKAKAFERAQAKMHQKASGMTRPDSGWGSRGKPQVRQAIGAQRGSIHRGGPGQSDNTRPEPVKKAGDKPMHPSWEAKRKLKEKESIGIVPSQGKKIKF